MRILENLGKAFVLQSVVFLALILAIIQFTPEEAARFYLYEFLGALMALIITTGGIYKMRDIT